MANFNAPKSDTQKKAAAGPVSHAYSGDEVYFHKAGQPVAGKVVCSGKHGCTVEHEGQQHKIKWSQLAGHKKRAPQRYTVVDQGSDGMIVQDATGKRRFVAIPPESRGERLSLANGKQPR